MNLGVKGDLKQEIFNEVNENVRALERLFPSVVKDGQVDFEALKEKLGQFEEVGAEKYVLTWSGKQNAKKIAQQDIVGKTLKYIPEDSKNPETTENLYIEGDNLEVLKLLRQNYYGAIKMIYIDPPYNTGNDFVYNDNFKKSKNESDIEEGDLSDLGERYTVNSKSSNKYHANWLDMMYPRLKVAKDLLRDDGIIFISIDDTELSNIKKLCEEIFSEDNFMAILPWKKKQGGGNDSKNFVIEHEYILVYCKSIINYQMYLDKYHKLDDGLYPFKDENGEYGLVTLDKSSIRFSESLVFDIIGPDGEIYKPRIVKGKQSCWRWGKDKVTKEFNDLVFKNGKVYTKYRRPDGVNPRSLLVDSRFGRTEVGKEEIKELLGKGEFSYPKPISLIKHFLHISTKHNDTILDFFSGSATTAHAVMKLNYEDGENRKFIMVQLPEETDIKSEAYKAGYKNICEIGKERIRRAGEKIKEENKDKEGIEDLDIGFKAFRVGDTNIRWNYEKEDLKTLSNEVTIRSSEEQTTFDFIAATNHQVNLDETVSAKDRLDFMPGAKDIDIVYEILLRQRDIPLSAKVELLEDIGKRTYIFADSYLVCLEEDITVELIEKLAELNPLPIKFILRDSAFGDDIALKDEAYRRLKALIERNSGESKKTYTVEFI
ncbi:site-specific DNA-methyltransferase [uncultured Clostridium sp.]|uniref:site-specific DNA-methyltransferase n=1 Tax=uncultured Clostridium sp. TaxID=59620 RepID=UPI0025DECCE6|nr:site-specific DNA-methyltransferase [uncultured Clostridium sp.]